jgi:capsule polysaccharide export protein KpsE/RkpR
MESIQIKGGNLIEFVERATGNAPSKEEHSNLISNLKKESIQVEKKLKKTKKLQQKVDTEVLSLTARLKGIDEQIAKSQKIVKSFLGGSRKTKKTKTSYRGKK